MTANTPAAHAEALAIDEARDAAIAAGDAVLALVNRGIGRRHPARRRAEARRAAAEARFDAVLDAALGYSAGLAA